MSFSCSSRKIFVRILFFVSIFYAVVYSGSVFSQPNIKSYRFKTTSSGVGIKIFKKGKGNFPSKEDRCFITYSYYHKNDTSKLKTIVEYDKKSFLFGVAEVLKGWEEGISLLRVGDSAVIRIPPHLAYGTKKVGSILPNSTLYLLLRFDSIQQIFFNSSQSDTIRFASGLKKIIYQKGSGVRTKKMDEITLAFTGYVFSKTGNRQIFESSKINSTEAVFQVGVGRFVKGLEEGLLTMCVGEKSTFVVPPDLGYGSQQAGKILPNTTLFYDIELISARYPFFNNSEYSRTNWINDSVKIEWILKKQGDTILHHDVVRYNYVSYYRNSEGNLVEFENSFKKKKVKTLRPGSGNGFPGIESALLYMKKGEKATITIPNSLIVMRNKMPFLPANAPVFFDLTIEDVLPYPFISFSNSDTVTLPGNLKMISSPSLSGYDSVTNGRQVKIAFTVYYVDKNKNRIIVDGTRDNGGKFYTLTVGDGSTIKGVEVGLLGMKPGQSRRLIIPPHLAYGENGLPEKGIPPASSLIFDIEKVEFINPAKP